MTKTIRVAERCGSYLASRRAAGELRAYVVMLLEVEKVGRVELDFAGVESVSNSFADGFIGYLVAERGRGWVDEHLELFGLADDDRADIDAVAEIRDIAHT